MVHKNRHSGSDQRFSSHSNLFSYLSPPAKRNFCYPTSPSVIHDSKKLNKLVGEVTITLNSVLHNIQTMTLLRRPPSPPRTLITIALYHLMKQDPRTMGYSCPNAPSLMSSPSPKDIISAFSNSSVHIPDTQFPSFMFCPDTKWQDLLLAEEG